MFYDKFVCLCEQKGISPSGAAVAMGINKATVTNWKKNFENGNDIKPTTEVLNKISEYFEVSIDYLVSDSNRLNITENDIKFALFGDGDITDEMYDEVKNFAEYVKQKYKNKKE